MTARLARHCGVVLLLAILIPTAASAQFIVDIDARADTVANPVTLSLPAGTYQVTPIDIVDGGTYTAWSPWSFVSGCDSEGANCTEGWAFNYRIAVGSLPLVVFGASTYFATPQQAFDQEILGTFTLDVDDDVSFSLGDVQPLDNRGGVSLLIEPAATPTLPESWSGMKARFE